MNEIEEIYHEIDRAELALDRVAMAVAMRSGRAVHLHDVCRHCGEPLRLAVFRLTGFCSSDCRTEHTNGNSQRKRAQNSEG